MSEVSLFGRVLQSPVIIGSGPLSHDAGGMIALHRAGAGAVVAKSMKPKTVGAPPLDNIAQIGSGTLMNCETVSPNPRESWDDYIENEIPKAVGAGVNVIASIGPTVTDISSCSQRLEEMGVYAFEVVSHDLSTLVPMVRFLRRHAELPVIVKLSPAAPSLGELARRLEDAGADGFTMGDAHGPALRVDIESGRPTVLTYGEGLPFLNSSKLLKDNPSGEGWLSGAAILPFTLQRVSVLRRATSLPIIGLGGVTRWQDAIEMVLVGATVVGICSAAILQGPQVIGKISRGVDGYLAAHHLDGVAALSGRALGVMREEIPQPKALTFDLASCSHCGRCESVCPYGARSFDEAGEAVVDEDACHRCGLCVTTCSQHAIGVCY